MEKLQLLQDSKHQLRKLVNRANSESRNSPFTADVKMAEIVYDSLNRTIFQNTLVRPKLIVYNYTKRPIWGECEGYAKGHRYGENYTKIIRLQKYWPNYKKFIAVLAHEMVHQWEWDTKGVMTHGKVTFFVWADTLKEHGIRLSIT